MKVVIVTPYFYPEVGGLEQYVLSIARGLVDRFGWQVWVITSDKRKKLLETEVIKGIRVVRLHTSLIVSNTPVGFFWYNDLVEILKTLKPDIVNVHTPVPYISDVAALASKKLGIPFIVTYHNDMHKDDPVLQFMINVYYFFLGKKVLGLSNGIIATSMHYAKSSTILKTYIDKIQIVPPGVDRLYKGRKKISLAKYVLFVGQIDTTHSHKGLDYLVRAISLLRERCPDLKLIVIGKGNDISRYKLLSKTLGVRRKVVFKGFVAERRIISYYREALCLCLPSISNSEGFGMVILEAAAQHTPTIGCSVGGVPSVIINNKTGLLVRPKNAQQLADAIEKLYLSPKLALELGDEAYKQVVHRYQWYQQIDKTKHMLSRWEQNRSI